MDNQTKTQASAAIAAPLDISIVQQKTADFQFKMRELVHALADAPPHLQILQPERMYTQFFIDRAALQRLNEIAEQADFENFGVYFGLEDPITQEPLADPKAPGFGKLTCSFVGLNANNEVLSTHFAQDGMPAKFSAEETWPPPPPANDAPFVYNLTHDVTDVFAHFDAEVLEVVYE